MGPDYGIARPPVVRRFRVACKKASRFFLCPLLTRFYIGRDLLALSRVRFTRFG
jgi:hypothetical protein